MMSLLVICFSLLPAAMTAAEASGKITLTDPSGRQNDHSGVVIWLEPVAGKAEMRPGPLPTMVHKNKTFLPHVLAVTVGAKVSFPNQDPFFHNAFSNYDGQIFDVGLHAPRTAREVTFRRPGVVRVFCNIHPTMSAVIVVLETPYFAVSDSKGAYSIPGVPPGEYRLHVFHERVKPEALKAVETNLTLEGTPASLPALQLSTDGFLETPHKNKFGKEYPAVIQDRYPGQAQ